MELSENTFDEAVVLSISVKMLGDTDSQLLWDKVKDLASAGKNKIVFDIKNVKLINSIGIGILMSCWTTLGKIGGQLKLVNVGEKISDLLELTELDQFFDTYDSIEEAVTDF